MCKLLNEKKNITFKNVDVIIINGFVTHHQRRFNSSNSMHLLRVLILISDSLSLLKTIDLPITYEKYINRTNKIPYALYGWALTTVYGK